MEKLPIDLKGEISLLQNGGRISAIHKEYWGHGNIKGEKDQNSYVLYLDNLDLLKPGQTTTAEFRFKFIDVRDLILKLKKNKLLNFMKDYEKLENSRSKKRLLDTLKHSNNIKQYRKTQRFDFENEVNDFKILIADKDKLFIEQKIYEGVITLLHVGFGVMLILLVIKLFGQR